MPHGPAEVGVGPWPGPLARRGSSTTRSCSPRATGATSSTATATGRWRRSSPTSTPGATTSTSPSRTGSTTSTSARSCAPPTRSSPREVHIVGNRRWNRRGAMVTDRYQHVRHHDDVDDAGGVPARQGVDAARHRQPARAREHLETWTLPRSVCFLFGQEGPGLSEDARGRRATAPSRSRSSARPARSTPRRPRRSRCTPGSGSTRVATSPGADRRGAGVTIGQVKQATAVRPRRGAPDCAVRGRPPPAPRTRGVPK